MATEVRDLDQVPDFTSHRPVKLRSAGLLLSMFAEAGSRIISRISELPPENPPEMSGPDSNV